MELTCCSNSPLNFPHTFPCLLSVVRTRESEEIFKMADSEESIVNNACDTNGKLTVKTGVSCQHCDKLNAELHKVYVELLSYEKVVSVLQEEIRNLECCRNYNDMYQEIHSKTQTHEIEMDNNWNHLKCAIINLQSIIIAT